MLRYTGNTLANCKPAALLRVFIDHLHWCTAAYVGCRCAVLRTGKQLAPILHRDFFSLEVLLFEHGFFISGRNFGLVQLVFLVQCFIYALMMS